MLGKPANEPAAPDDRLPADVLAAIEGAFVFPRPDGDDGMPRTVVQPAGLRGWVHSDEADDKAIRTAWPYLSDAQVGRAKRFIASTVAIHLRAGRTARRQRTSWIHSWKD